MHLFGTGFYEAVPEAELPPTTTTTRADGVSIPQCPVTRPATSVVATFYQEGRTSVELGRVAGDTIDLDVTIPADAVPGPAQVYAGSGQGVELTILPGATRIQRPDQIPRTGFQAGLATVGAALVGCGLLLIAAASRRRGSLRA